MNEILDLLIWPYIITVVLIAYSFKKYMETTKRKLPVNIRFVVLFIGFVCGIVYYFAYVDNVANYLLSFAVATSLYDLLLKWFLQAIEKRMKNDKPTPPDLG